MGTMARIRKKRGQVMVIRDASADFSKYYMAHGYILKYK